MSVGRIQGPEDYARAVAYNIALLFKDDEEDISPIHFRKCELNNIDGKDFLIGMAYGCYHIYKTIIDEDSVDILDFLYTLQKLVVYDLLESNKDKRVGEDESSKDKQS